MPTFECLYLLENFYLSIVGLRLLEVAENAPAPGRLLWLRLERHTGRISQLNLRSMDAATEIQERYFEEGFLKFSATIGTYIEKFNSAQHTLENRGTKNLNDATAEAINGYLLALQQTA